MLYLFIISSLLLIEGSQSWDGMMGLVYQDKVDAAVGTIFYVKVSFLTFISSRSLNLCRIECQYVNLIYQLLTSIQHIQFQSKISNMIFSCSFFLSFIYFTTLEYLFHRGRVEPKWTAILRPFQLKVWIAIGATLLTLTLSILYFIQKTKNATFNEALKTITVFVIPVMLSQDIKLTNIRKTMISRKR